jgi:hypothetical protein
MKSSQFVQMNIVTVLQSFFRSYIPWYCHHESLEVKQIPQNGMSHPENNVQNNKENPCNNQNVIKVRSKAIPVTGLGGL